MHGQQVWRDHSVLNEFFFSFEGGGGFGFVDSFRYEFNDTTSKHSEGRGTYAHSVRRSKQRRKYGAIPPLDSEDAKFKQKSKRIGYNILAFSSPRNYTPALLTRDASADRVKTWIRVHSRARVRVQHLITNKYQKQHAKPRGRLKLNNHELNRRTYVSNLLSRRRALHGISGRRQPQF